MKIKVNNLYLYLGMFGLLYPGFTISLWSHLYPASLRYVVPLFSLFLIFLYGLKTSSAAAPRNLVVMFTLMFLVILYGNYDVSGGVYVYLLMYAVVFLMTLCLVSGVEWFEKAFRVIQIFCVLHLAAGLFLLFNKDLLISRIIPLFNVGDGAIALLHQAINNGYMTGLTYHYSTMGMYMSLGTIAFSGFLFNKNKKIRFREAAVFILMFLGVFLTGKRGALLFTVIAIIWVYVLLCLPRTEKQLKRMFIGAIVAVALFFTAYVAVPQVKSVIERFTSATGGLNELSTGRVEYFWLNALSMFEEHPVLGNGWRSFRRQIVAVFGLNNANDAHNIYIQLLAEVGIVGFLIFAVFMIASWRAAYLAIRSNMKTENADPKCDMYMKVALVYQTFFILYGFTGNPLYDLQCYVPYFICTAVGWAGYYCMKKRVNNNKTGS